MEPDKTPELQQADDMMMGLMEQRNAALNEVVQLRAQLRAAAREMETLTAKIPQQPPAEADRPVPTVPAVSVANGRDTTAAAPVVPIAAEPKPAPVKAVKPPAPPKSAAKRRGRPPKKKIAAAAPVTVTAVEPASSAAPVVATSEPPPDAVPTG